jgi:CO dehydrogenase/acetyl-CoA synthase beta subunit/CO dehydrogenase/acetyl-CoA synthase delta subunit
VNGASGVQHIGQRDIAWIRISKAAYEKGFNLEHFGKILHARFHADFGAIVDKVQVKIITDPELHAEWLAQAREAYDYRNQRLADMTDESVDTFYSCILCQSFAPDHVCVISPERLGLCGAYNWLDCKASFEINPTGPNQPILKGPCLDPTLGYWQGTNDYARQASHGSVERVTLYSIMNHPMTACGCFECIAMMIPEANGIMVVSREDASMTPAGMKFSTLAGIAGGGIQTPGMMGIGKYYLLSPKFISADGGFQRIVWMSKNLKESMSSELQAVAEREGDPELISRIADGDSVTEVDELVQWLEEHDHPALDMEPMQPVEEPEELGVPAMAAAGTAEAPAPAAAAPKPAAQKPAAQKPPEPKPAAVAKPAAEKPAAEKPAPEPVVEEPAAQKPVVEKQVAQKPAKPAGELPEGADMAAIAQMSADIVLDQIRAALGAALQQLGGTVPAAGKPAVQVPSASAMAPAPAAPEVAEEAPAAVEEEIAEPEPEPVRPRKERPEPVGAPWIKGDGAQIKLVQQKWTGKVLEIQLGATPEQGGTRSRALVLGGETTLPYLYTEGEIPHKPAVAIEIADSRPTDWSPLLMEAWGDVMDDPAKWAAAAEAKGAEALLLRLSATKDGGSPMTAADARATVRAVLDASGLPLMVYGPGQVELDNELLVAVAEEGKGERLVLGKCEENNYRTIVAAALANEHLVVSSTAMDVNLAKQLNILISDMGLPLERIVMDPTCAAVGYGMEYGYSVMERLRLAALNGDRMTQLPMMVTVGYEAWRQKETRVDEGVPEAWGAWKERALNWETLTAAALIESAANLLVLRHPKSVQRIHKMIDELMAGNGQ